MGFRGTPTGNTTTSTVAKPVPTTDIRGNPIVKTEGGFMDELKDSWEGFRANPGEFIGDALKNNFEEGQAKRNKEAQRPFQFNPKTGEKVFMDKADSMWDEMDKRKKALDQMVSDNWVKL